MADKDLGFFDPDLDDYTSKPIRVTQRGVAMITRATYEAMVEAKDGDFNVRRGLKKVLTDHRHLFEDPSLDRVEGRIAKGNKFRSLVPDEDGIYQILHDPSQSSFKETRLGREEIQTPIKDSDNPKLKAQYQKLLGEAEAFKRAFPIDLTHRHTEIYKDFLWQNEILAGQSGEGFETQRLQRTVDAFDNVNPTDDPTLVRPTELFLTDKAAAAFEAGNFEAKYNISLDPPKKGRPPDSPIQAIEKPTQQIAITGTKPSSTEIEIKKGDSPYYKVPEGREHIPNMLVTNSKRLLKMLNQGERISGADIATAWDFAPVVADGILRDLQQENIIKIVSGQEGSSAPEYDVNKNSLWKLDRPNIKWIHGLTDQQRKIASAEKKQGTDITVSSQASVPSTAIPPPTPKFNPETKIQYGPDGTRLTPVGALNVPKYKIDLMNQGFTRAVKEYAESNKKAAKKDFIQMWWDQSKKVAKLLGQDLSQQDFRTGRDVAFVNENLVPDPSGSKAKTKSLVTDGDVPVRMKPAKGVVKDVVPFIPDPTDSRFMLIPRNAHATSLSPAANKEKINLSLKNALDNAKNPRIRLKGLTPWFLDPLIGATIAGGAAAFDPKVSWAGVAEAAALGGNPFDVGATEVGRGSEYSAAQAFEDREIAAEDALAEKLGYDLSEERRAKSFDDVYYDAPRPVHLRDILTPEEINELTDPMRKKEGKTEKSFLDYR